MKKKWAGILTMMLTILVLVSTAVPVLAQSEGEAPGGTSPIFRAGLAIVAPGVAPVGEEVSMTVFDRQNQLPVKDAGIWALTQENAEILKVEIDRLREESAASIQELDWESLVSGYGFFLGMTQGNGQLKYTFAEEGGYVLIAIKQGYYPGRTFIAIRTIPVALAIQAPKRASSGEEVTMTVLQKGTGEPVKDAGVWAITRDNAEVFRAEIARLKEESTGSGQELNIEPLVSAYGFFLGTTHGKGQLNCAFSEAGWYLLVAVKGGCIPGGTGIAIMPPRTDEPTNSQQSMQ